MIRKKLIWLGENLNHLTVFCKLRECWNAQMHLIFVLKNYQKCSAKKNTFHLPHISCSTFPKWPSVSKARAELCSNHKNWPKTRHTVSAAASEICICERDNSWLATPRFELRVFVRQSAAQSSSWLSIPSFSSALFRRKCSWTEQT